ncbi:unnamed protein product [Schistosoma guineensis]|nr:unnamed protein product [Schistosoma guineensis]
MTTPILYRRCVNCKENITELNFDIHEAFCCRNVIICPDCGVSLLKTKLLEHQLDEHSKIKCTYCDSLFQESSVMEHEFLCPRRLVECAFCNLGVTIDLLEDHEYTCGARTERCSECGEFVMLKSRQTHRCKKPIECLTNLQNDLEKDFCVALNLQYEDYIQNVHSTTLQKHIGSQTDTSHHKTTVERPSNENVVNEWESNSIIPCEFCHSCYSIDMIHEHQVLCLLENDSLMSATEEQTNKPNDLCNQVTTNTERTPNSCNISQAAGSCINPSIINSIKVQSKKFPSTSQQLKSTNRKSVQCSTSSSTSSSSSLTLPQNNPKHIKTSINPFSSSRINNKTISMNKNQDPLKLVRNPSKHCFTTKTVNHSLDSNSSLNLQKMKKNNTIKSKGFSK